MNVYDNSEISALKAEVADIIAPLKPADEETVAPKDMLFVARRTNEGRNLPPYYIVYFLLVELLGFQDLGRWEKVAFSIPVDFNGVGFVVEHRKFGLGLFAADPKTHANDARQIVQRIGRASKRARPYFELLASRAADGSRLNVANHSRSLFERFDYLRRLYRQKADEAIARKDEKRVEEILDTSGKVRGRSTSFPAFEIKREARWLGVSAVEAFFSWTEHVFIQMAIVQGHCTTGQEVGKLAAAEWPDKFKAALDISDPETKKHYDELIQIRRLLRNFVAHGAFGKDGQAFSFHSAAGAVPLLLPHQRTQQTFRFGNGADLDASEAIEAFALFEQHFWTGTRGYAKSYVQDYALPLILTMAADGAYERALQSAETMSELTDRISQGIDRSANMDW